MSGPPLRLLGTGTGTPERCEYSTVLGTLYGGWGPELLQDITMYEVYASDMQVLAAEFLDHALNVPSPS